MTKDSQNNSGGVTAAVFLGVISTVQTVPLGKTGLEVSRLCFGTLTIGPLQANLPLEEGAAVLAHAMERDVCFFDTAQLYRTYPYLRRAMELTSRVEPVISTKTYAYSRDLAVEAVEEARRELNRDCIDIFLLHEQESVHTLRGHAQALEYLYECKQKGIIRAVGASMHHIAAVEGATAQSLDCIHPLLNCRGLGIADGSRTAMQKAVQAAYENGIGVFSMKPLGGGNLFQQAQECLEWILGLPYVHSIAVGMQSIQEVDANIEFFQTGAFSADAKRKLESRTRRLHIDSWCTGCGQCAKRCASQAISVADHMAHCDHSKCVLCGYCSTVCPEWAIKVV